MTWDGAFHLVNLPCVCSSGETHQFEVRTLLGPDPEGEVLYCYAKPLPPGQQGDAEYFATFKRLGLDLFQLDGVTNGLPARYQRCGITRALLPHIATRYATRIRSSRHRPLEGETRTPSATRVWQRMVDEKSAQYDATEDRYYYPRPV